MAEPNLGFLQRFSTINNSEANNVLDVLGGRPLSGYIGGNPKGGYWIERLTEEWGDAFEVKYAAPCNSATSGLLAACMAIGVKAGDEVWTTPYSMSATAACAKVLGAWVRFIDIETDRFGIDPGSLAPAVLAKQTPKAIIVTNLFGHPARLHAIKRWCDEHDVILIEDNAQSPFATVDGEHTGTIGDIGVFSLNVHKHIQCGEGGVIVTNDDTLAHRLQCIINHGELAPSRPFIGLNLRMTEPIAAIACAQLAKAKEIIEGRREIGLAMCDMVKDVPWIKAHGDQPGCKHVYYLWSALTDTPPRLYELVAGLNRHGIPARCGYAPLLHKLFKSDDNCPVVEDVDSRIVVFEVCAYDLRQRHMGAMREIIKRVTGEIDEDRQSGDQQFQSTIHSG